MVAKHVPTPFNITQIRFAEMKIKAARDAKRSEWNKKNPQPERPSDDQILSDIRRKKFKMSNGKFGKAVLRLIKGYTVEVDDLLDVDCLQKHYKAVEGWQRDKDRFEKRLQDHIDHVINMLNLKGLDPMEAIYRATGFII